MHLPPIVHHIPTGRPSPAEVGNRAAAEGADIAEQIGLVANSLVQELREYHHPWIPIPAVRTACVELLAGGHATGSWEERTGDVYVAVERALLDGGLYDRAERESAATTTVRVGRVASQSAADQVRGPHGQPAYEVVHETWERTLCRALDYLSATGNTLPAMLEAFDAFDHYDAATGKALLQYLTAVPAEDIATITPSRVLADARAAGARPEHVLDAVAVSIAAVMEPVTGTDFFDLLPAIAADVRESAHGWLAENVGVDPGAEPIDYKQLGGDKVAGMLDHVARLAREYDMYAG
ncbi:hypothetical protein AB0392_34090 [Nonomuraea angiospora]|uniref:hypothetical protein n=1 Tax=Nonomuraea angiospora TaxID=46172 RepID=UPI00344D569F